MVHPQKNKINFLNYATGTILTIIGFSMYFAWTPILEKIAYMQMALTSDSRTFPIWRDTPIKQYMTIYFFNWTNPEELGIKKPKLVEQGPYQFRIEEKKTHIVFNENGTVTYKIARFWHFDEANSNGTLNDTVTTLNAVALSAAHTVRNWRAFMQKGLSMKMSMDKIKINITQKVGDLLFYGYEDPLIDTAKNLPGVEIPFDKFAWFYQRNGSSEYEGVFNMDTGVNNINDFGKLHFWNYQTRSGFFEDTCGSINGSAGELFPPKQNKVKNIEMFSADLCRSISLKYEEEVEYSGINGYRYIGPEFDNGTRDESNQCFCNGECSPIGVVNETSCRYGAPGFVSYPHFYQADPFYLDQVEGLKPSRDKHLLYITLEPETGIPIDVAARFQINILLYPNKYISLLKNVPTIYFPMLWFEQRASISMELAQPLSLLFIFHTCGTIFGLFLFLIGIVIIVSEFLKASKRNTFYVPSPEAKTDITETELPLMNTKKTIIVERSNVVKNC